MENTFEDKEPGSCMS